MKILFHFSKVTVGIEFAREKKIFLTGFTHCKVALWKRCELGLPFEPLIDPLYIEKSV